MNPTFKHALIIVAFGLFLSGCKPRTEPPEAAATPTPPNLIAAETAVPITLPVLDALFAGEAFKAELKSKLQLTDEQIAALRRISSAAVTKLRTSNAEKQSGSAEAARQNAIDAIR